jgi:beta-1,2-mannobiose phosphorylase / 1,2-beta-oligomannan phosphorylase
MAGTTKHMVASRFRAERLGVVMRPDPAREEEVEGVLNPGAARGPDGTLYLFPRVVGRKNYSRIGIARVIFDDAGKPSGVERLGIALEPKEWFELRPAEGTGGVEDPRVTFVQPLGLYVMAYVAWGPHGPRVALAISENCLHWERIGLVDFQPDPETNYGVSLNDYDNKDAAFGPDSVPLGAGLTVLAMFHRPQYDATNAPHGVEPHAGIWVSACDLDAVKRDVRMLRIMKRHAIVAEPKAHWEALRIGLGTPPVFTRLGYLTVYHGVSGALTSAPGQPKQVTYDAGVLVFRREGNRLYSHRTARPILVPELVEETHGVVDNVVFPTGIDKHSDGVFDVYYGMADRYIGVVRVWIPKSVEYEEMDLPEIAPPEHPEHDPARNTT